MNSCLGMRLPCIVTIRYFSRMPSVIRHRSLLLSFCALALLLLTSAGAMFGMQLHHGLSAHPTAPSAMTAEANQAALVDDAGDPSNASTSDDLAGNSSQPDDDCDMDDKLFLPIPVHAMLDPRRSGKPVDTASSLRSGPSADLLRPPRAA